MRNLKRALSLTLASVMLLGMMVVGSSAAGYPDVSEEENIEAIEVLQAVGVMGGDENGNFNPDDYVTREQMAVIMAQLLKLDYNYYKGTNPFSDVPEWAAPYVAACAANGVTAGIGGGLYGSKQNIQAVQAALMMLKALGYFQYSGDYGDSYVLATVKQGTEIGLFKGIDSNADSPLTRNQVAQMALNALKAEMVSFTGDPGATIPTANGDVVIGYKAEYTPRTSTESKYQAIEPRSSDVSDDANHRGQYYIQLGEQLYDGELKLYNNRTDDFGRPSRYWEYDGKAIGTYMKKELLKQEWTVEVTGKDFYDLLGSDVIKDYTFDVTIDGVSIDEKTGATVNNTVLTDNAASYFDETYMAKTYKTGVGKTGKGVLTQVFVDPDGKQVDIAVINTYLAKATADYSEKKDEASFDVYGLTSNGASGGNEVFYKYYDATNKLVACEKDDKQAEKLTVSGEDFDVAGVKKDDIFLVTAANGEIKTMTEPQIIAGTSLDAFSLNKYVVSGGTQYDYNTTIDYDPDVLEDYTSQSAGEKLKDIEYNLYLDAYGYLIGVDVVEATRNYIFLTGIDRGSSNLGIKVSEAAGILLDGTFVDFDMNMTDSRRADGTTKFSGHPLLNTWCTYTVDKNGTYTLKEVGDYDDAFPGPGNKAAKAGQYADMVSNNKTIDSKRPSLGAHDNAGTIDKFVYGNDNSVYILAELEEVAAKNAVAATHPVPGDGSVDNTSNGVAEDDPVVIISGVDNYGVGINNVNMKTFANATDIPGHADSSSSPAYPGWIYTLFDNKGYVIAAVVVGEDDGTSKNLVYVDSSKTKEEWYNSADDEHTWTREVIANGERATLKEIDSGLSKLKSMTQNTWYEVTYKADGSVKSVKHAYFDESGKNIGGKAAPTDATLDIATANSAVGTTSKSFMDNIEFVENMNSNGKSTYLYEEVWGLGNDAGGVSTGTITTNAANGHSTNKSTMDEDNQPSLDGSMLYVDTDAAKGFYVDGNVKCWLIQNNGDGTKSTDGVGTSDLEKMLDSLNFKNGSYLFKISAIITNGHATTVIIHDWNEGEATGNDKNRNPAADTPSGETVKVAVTFKAGATPVDTKIIDVPFGDGIAVLNDTDTLISTKLSEVNTAKSTNLEITSTASHVITGPTGIEVTVAPKTKTLTVGGTSWEISWDADAAKYITARAAAAPDGGATTIEVPVGAAVTVDPKSDKASTHYLYNPEGATKMVSGDNLTFTMPDKAVTLTADKWFKVAATATVTSDTTNDPTTGLGDVEIASTVDVVFGTDAVEFNSAKYVKGGDKVTVSFSATEATEAENAGSADTYVKLDAASVSTNATMTAVKILESGKTGADVATAGANCEVTIAASGTPTGGNLTLAFLVSSTT